MSFVINPYAFSGFSPVSLSVFGIEADTLGLAHNDPVSSWTELVAGNHPVQATGANKPLYNSAGAFPYVQFDGSNDILTTGANLNLSGTNNVHFFLVLKLVTDAALGVIFEQSANYNSNFPAWILYSNGDGTKDTGYESTGGSVRRFTNSLTAGFVLLEITGDKALTAAEVKAYVGGVLTGTMQFDTNTIGNFGSFLLNIGARSGASLPANLSLAALYVCDHILTGTDLTDMRNYFTTKYGL